MELRVFDRALDVARSAADVVQAAAAQRPDLALALPTGRTPIDFYDELARRHARSEIDLSKARAFNLDELVLAAADPRTFHEYMRVHVWGRTGLTRERAELPDGGAVDLDRECRRYDAAILAAGGIDLAILGLGIDGHVAYNVPGAVSLSTHVVLLPDAIAASLDAPGRKVNAITMGLGTIRSARAIVILATGSSKSRSVEALVRGGSAEDWPCTFLRDHANLQLLVDRPAAALVSRAAP